METVNIKVSDNSKFFSDSKPKNAAKLENDNPFSMVISKLFSEDGIKPDVIEKNKYFLAADISIKPKLEEDTDEQLMQLMQLLTNLGNTAKNSANELGSSDVQLNNDKLKQIVSELLVEGASEGTLLINSERPNLNTVYSKGLIVSEGQNKIATKQQIENITSQIVDKLLHDSDVKTQLVSMLNKEIQKTSNDESKSFKQELIKELTSLIDSQAINETEKTVDLKEFSTKSTANKTVETSQSVEETKAEKSEPFIEDTIKNTTTSVEVSKNEKILTSADLTKEKKTLADDNSFTKENKILKDLIGEDSKKNTKEAISDKIANVITRFEVIRTDKPVAADSQVVIHRDNFNADFIKTVKFMDLNNIKELSVKILPKDLGEIVIRLSMDNGIMKADITAANKDTYSLLNAQLPAISTQLSEQNMNIQSFSLSLYNGDNFLFNGNGSNEGSNKRQGKRTGEVSSIEEKEKSLESYSADNSSVNILA